MSDTSQTKLASPGAVDSSPSIRSPHRRTMLPRLVLMMLLQFLVFGSWFATFGLVLATHGLAAIIGPAYSLAAVAAILSPMLFGAIADRFLASQLALGLAHLVGAGLMFALPTVVGSGRSGLALGLIFVYMLFFQPTLGLAPAIALRHLRGQEQRFPTVRVFGTVGWVIAGLLVGWMGLSASTDLFYVTAGISVLAGLYSFTLPHTPAPARGVGFRLGDVVGAQAFTLLRHRNYGVLMVCALLTAIALGVYNAYGATFLGAMGIRNVAGVLAIGQAAEVVFILAIPFALKHFGMKWSLFAGMVMWGVRFAVLILAGSTGSVGLAVLGVALQGICNDFFLVLAAMYIGTVVPLRFSAQAQGMLILMVSGFGQLIGSFVSGQIYGATVAALPASTAADWWPVFLLPIVSGMITAVVWSLGFRQDRGEPIRPLEDPATAPAEVVPA